MIKFVSGEYVDDLKEICRHANVCACRIMCLYDSWFSCPDMVMFWVQYTDGGMPAAAISKYGADVNVYMTETSDKEELIAFLNMLGAASVTSNERLLDNSERGAVMAYQGSTNSFGAENEREEDIPFLQIYSLLKKCEAEDFAVPSYEDFILDMSHRLRHRTALCSILMDGDRVAACSMTAAMSENTAVIGAVCTDPEYRRMGLGTKCVQSLLAKLGSRNIFIMRAEHKNEVFYQELGFENTGFFYRYLSG